MQRMVIKLSAIIGLQAGNELTKLCADVCVKANYGGKNIRLVTQGKCPNIVSAIIKYNKIKFVTKIANNWRRPHITV